MRLNVELPAKPIAALIAFLALCLFAPGVFAQAQKPVAKTNAPAANGNRFLLIVDTSSSMKSGASDMLQAVAGIILSSANGQMHRGDTFGVWTFNRELYAGVLPLQTWMPEETNQVAQRTSAFLKQQHYRYESHLDKALEGMYAVIQHSDIITVFIISNGQNPMQGTPFDQQINALYAESLKEMKRDRKPIVTVLQAKHGKLIRYTVNALPWPVVIPEVPIPIKGAEIAETPPPEEAPKTIPPVEAPKNVPPVAVAPSPSPQPAAPLSVPPTHAPVVTPPPAAPVVVTPPPPVAPPQSAPPVVTPKPLPVHLPTIAQIPRPAGALPAPGTPGLQPRAQTPPPVSPMVPIETPRRTNAPAIPNPRPVVAQAPVPPPYAGSKYLLISAIASGVVGLALIALLIMRLRAPAPGPSLITRTMGEPPKK